MCRWVIALTFILMGGVAYAQQSSPPPGNPVERLNQHLDESRARAGAAAAKLRDRQRQDEETLRELDRIDQQK